MAAVDPTCTVQTKPDKHVAAESFRDGDGFTRSGLVDRDTHVAVRKLVEHLFDQRHAGVDLLDADPDTRIDVAFL
jgi:hypothetical protein